MNTSSKIFGNHVFFCRTGDAFTLPGAGTIGRNSKPEAADPVWIEMGIIAEDFDIEKKEENVDIFAPSPGRYRRYDVISLKQSLDITFKTKEFSPLAFQLLFGTAALDAVLAASSQANKQYNPLAGTDVYGWVKVAQYDQTDTLVNTFDSYCRLMIDGAISFGPKIIDVPYKAMLLFSQYNTGVLS